MPSDMSSSVFSVERVMRKYIAHIMRYKSLLRGRFSVVAFVKATNS